jgi:septal ring factor EnvC (AmiA/AmiB activator)
MSERIDMKTRLPVLLALLLFFTAAGYGADSAPQTREELDAVRRRIDSLEKELGEAARARPSAGVALKEAELAEATARRALREVRTRLAAARAEEKRLRTAIDRAEQDIAAQRAALEGQLRLAWTAGQAEWLRLVLSQQDPAALSRRVAYYGYVTRQRGTLLKDLQAQTLALQAAVDALQEELRTLAGLEQREAARVQELTAARKVRAQALRTLEKDLGTRKQKLVRLRRDARSLQQLLDRLQREARNAVRESPRTEPRPLPGATVKGLPVRGRMLARFGQPRADGLLRWDGLLLAAPAGTEVRAVQSGKVVYADWLPGMGLLLVLDHGQGYMSLYGHNQDLLKTVGDRVDAGEVISRVGDSGGQGSPGLYFEMRRNGKPVNPSRWVR